MFIKMPFLALLFVMLPFDCYGQNVIVRPSIFFPEKGTKQSDVCLNVVRQAQICLQTHPLTCHQLADFVAQLEIQCGSWKMGVPPNPAFASRECRAGCSTFKVLFIIFATGFLLAIAGLAAMAILHFRRK